MLSDQEHTKGFTQLPSHGEYPSNCEARYKGSDVDSTSCEKM